MGGHGGLNILPQKKWNVYNFENREKVRKDEEEAAREEQLKQDQSRRRDAEFRIQLLRQARGLATPNPNPNPSSDSQQQEEQHINLFENLQDFPSLAGDGDEKRRSREEETNDGGSKKKRRKEEGRSSSSVVVAPEDEKYKLGYGLAGKGVKAPWYLSKPSFFDAGEGRSSSIGNGSEKKIGGKKSIEELREERMRREKKEKERERALLASKKNERFSRRRA